jgi:hypothetical protein
MRSTYGGRVMQRKGNRPCAKAHWVFSCLLAVLPLSAFSFPAHAQSAAASGIVTDPVGKAVGGAEVILVKNDLATTRTVLTNESGTFTAASMPSGSYTNRVRAPGLVLRIRAQVALGVHSSVHLTLQSAFATVVQSATDSSRGPKVGGVFPMTPEAF